MMFTRNHAIASAALSLLALVFIMINLGDVYAYIWKAPGAIVWPNGCNSDSCALKGTLRVVPWTKGAQELTMADGSIVRLAKGSSWKVSYPTTNP